MSTHRPVHHIDDLPSEESLGGDHWGGSWQVLTPTMREAGGKLGLVLNRMPPGRVGCPFHTHQLEDEVFYILEGRGVLRYGEELFELRPGDCVSCPAGTQVAHQIGNPYDEELVYLAMGPREPHEICGYPDSGKTMVRTTQTVGLLEKTEYMHGEGEVPRIFELVERES